MKIAVNTRFLLKDRLEGIGWYTYEIMRRLVQNHPEDEFYFLFDRPYDPQFIFADNVHPVVLQPPARHPLLFYIWFEYSVYNFLKKQKIDIFFSPDGFLSLRTRVPTFLTIHDIAYKHYPQHVGLLMRKYYQYFMPKFVVKARKVFTVSQYSKKDICSTYSVNEDKVLALYNGCRNIFKPISNQQKEAIKQKYTQGNPYFICIGSVHPRKNIERVIRAFQQIKEESDYPHRLVLTGRMAWKSSEVRALISQPPLSNHILWTGNVKEDELVQLLGGSEGLVYPSLFEGFGMPILEAMHCHVPVITSNTSSMPEVGGDAAYYVNPSSVKEISGAMLDIILNSAKKMRMIELGKKQMLKFNWDVSAQRIYQCFTEIK